jgi:glycosyltransferase involved in cell wall biosynthesis
VKVTVGIPVYNEERSIANALQSVLSQKVKAEIKVIVVASGCTDETVNIVNGILDPRVSLIVENKRKGKSSAWNIIKKAAKTDYIVYTDGDILLDNTAIQTLIDSMGTCPTLKAIGGVPVPISNGNSFLSFINTFPYHNPSDRLLSGYLYLIKRDAMDLIPNHVINEDDYISSVLGRENFLIDEDAKVFVEFPKTLRDYCSQKIRIYAGKRQRKSEYPIKTQKIHPLERLKKVKGKEFLYLPGYILITSYCRTIARIRGKRKITNLWKPITSSKP